MRILIDIGHPAHVHLFKHFAWEMQKKGHIIYFTCREKEHEIDLLKTYGFNYKSFGKKYYNMTGKIWGLIEFTIKEIIEGLKIKPDIFLSHGSMYAAYASRILRKPHISLEDTGNMEQIRLYKPFTDVILTPDVLNAELGEKQIRYKGYHELAYLHPKQFKDEELPKELNKPYVIFRFVSWGASHDVGQSGINKKLKLQLINKIKSTHKVLISAEKELNSDFKECAFCFPPHLMHTILKNADIYVGEGATMASEAGVLGTPAIYVNSLPASNCKDLEKYGLVFNLKDNEDVTEKIEEIFNMPNLSKYFKELRDKLIFDKINVTDFIIWFVENYPESYSIMKNNPDYQNNFRN